MTIHDTKSQPSEAMPRQPLAAGDTPPAGSVVASDTSILTPSMVAADASVPPSVARLQHYRLLDLVGRGGMGDVYRAHDEMFNRIVAVKVLPPDLAKDEQFVGRFRREAKAVAGLSHPNILSIYTINHDRGHFFFAMQFVDGKSLEKRLRRVGVLPLHETLRIITACLSALEAAHAHGLIHRDIKPGNVLLQNGSDHVYLVDFGLVRRIDDQSLLTVTGMVMGTADYMAPEQARGQKNLDPRTDLYSVGAMLYYLLAGRLPFDAQSFQAMLYSHAYEQPFPLQEAAPNLPSALVEIVNRLLAKQPDDRPANCREVLSALEPFRKLSFRARHVTAKLEAAAQSPNSDAECATFEQIPESYGLWQRCSDRAASFIGRRTPQWLQELKSTEKQIDAVLSAAQRRRRQLLALRDEGRSLLEELQEQIRANLQVASDAMRQVEISESDDSREAALATREAGDEHVAVLQAQSHELRDRLDDQELRLAKVDAELATLQSQQRALQGRLAIVKRPPRKTLLYAVIAVVATLIAGMFLPSLAVHYLGYGPPAKPSTQSPNPSRPNSEPPPSPKGTTEPRPFLVTPPEQPPNTLTSEEVEAGWRLLFDGETTDGWVGYNSLKMPSKWRVENGSLGAAKETGPYVANFVVTLEQFADFELRIQWKVSEGSKGDGGIKYRVVEGPWQPYEVAPEMQVLGGSHDQGLELWSAGALWGLYAPRVDVRRPIGEWNDALVVANGSHVEHWLNGVKLLECEIGSDDWRARVGQSKFKDMPRFCKSPRGNICLQITPAEVQYRNIKLRELH